MPCLDGMNLAVRSSHSDGIVGSTSFWVCLALSLMAGSNGGTAFCPEVVCDTTNRKKRKTLIITEENVFLTSIHNQRFLNQFETQTYCDRQIYKFL